MGFLELLSPAHLSPKVWTSRLSQGCQAARFVFLLTQEESSTLVGPWKCRPTLVAKVVLGCLTVIMLKSGFSPYLQIDIQVDFIP